MASELGGLIIGGGLVLASSLFSASFNECKIDFAAKDEAIKIYNKQYETALTGKNADDMIVLAPCFSDGYSSVRYLMTSLGFQVTSKPGDQFITLDLSRLIRNYPSFESERKLSAALFAAGIVLSPGEAHGLEEPGFFRMSNTVLSQDVQDQIRERLLVVIRDFKCSDPYVKTNENKRPASELESVADALTENVHNLRKFEPEPIAAPSKTPKTAEKRRRVTASSDN